VLDNQASTQAKLVCTHHRSRSAPTYCAVAPWGETNLSNGLCSFPFSVPLFPSSLLFLFLLQSVQSNKQQKCQKKE